MLAAVSATVASTLENQTMATNAKSMLPTDASITIGRRARPTGIEIMSHLGFQIEQLTHHGLPFPTVGPKTLAVLEMPNQPMSHFVRHHFQKKAAGIFSIEQSVEAQPAAAKMCLAGAFAL